MNKKLSSGLLSLFLLLTLIVVVSASRYLDILRELDVRISCFLVWLAPLVTLLLLLIGGIRFMVSASPEKRDEAKAMLYNTVVGFFLVMILLLLAVFIGHLDLTRCWGGLGKPPDQPFLSTTTLYNPTTTLTPQCQTFFTCPECITQGCGWCYELDKCLQKTSCHNDCVTMQSGLPFTGWCLGPGEEAHCP